MADCFIRMCKISTFLYAQNFLKSFSTLCAQVAVYLADEILTIAKYNEPNESRTLLEYTEILTA